jgi:hypothetical protein
LGEQKGNNMIELVAPKGTFSMEWNGEQLIVRNGIVTAPDEALGDLFAHGCTAKEHIVVNSLDQVGDDQSQKTVRDALKDKAAALGLEFPSNVKSDKLAQMISEKESGVGDDQSQKNEEADNSDNSQDNSNTETNTEVQ